MDMKNLANIDTSEMNEEDKEVVQLANYRKEI